MPKVIYKLNEINQDYFYDNYDTVFQTLNMDNQTIYLDDYNNTCRFCKKTSQEVKFSNKCHATPEFLGNKKIITKNECDLCNHKYANLLEDDLSKYTLPMRIMTRVHGKNGVPKYRDMRDNSYMKFEEIYKISTNGNKQFLTIDKENKNLKLQFNLQPFTPIKAYKALVRIALNCLPKEYFDKFTLIDWLESNDDLGNLTRFYTTIINETFNSVPQSFNIYLFIRKNGKLPVPYCQMVLQTNNNFLQITIPFLNEDMYLANLNEILIYPLYLYKEKQDKVSIKTICLYNTEKVKIQQPCYITFENIKDNNFT